MSKQSEPGSSSGRLAPDAAASQPKRPYRTPRLVVYGRLNELALEKGGVKGDGKGNPASKA
jgi:hypothetical protein